MADYKEISVSGTKWQRAVRIVIGNPYQGIPTIAFDEEECINIDGDIIKRPVGGLSCAFNPTDTFPGIDPETDAPVGRDITHGEVYALLYSLYRHMAAIRDGQ